jgi:hypothetical protein
MVFKEPRKNGLLVLRAPKEMPEHKDHRGQQVLGVIQDRTALKVQKVLMGKLLLEVLITGQLLI